MKVLMPGATRNVGRLVVHQALELGHEVVAIVRNPAALGIEHPRLQLDPIDLDVNTVPPVLAGIEAVTR